MNIYMTIAFLHLKRNVTRQELAVRYKNELKEYVHQHHEHAISYVDPLDAVNAIIDCEIRSQHIAKKF